MSSSCICTVLLFPQVRYHGLADASTPAPSLLLLLVLPPARCRRLARDVFAPLGRELRGAGVTADSTCRNYIDQHFLLRHFNSLPPKQAFVVLSGLDMLRC